MTTIEIEIACTKFKVEKFSRKNDFGLWKIKMKATLIQQRLADALKWVKGLAEKPTNQHKEEMMEKACDHPMSN